MISLFERNLTAMEREVAALKTDRIKSAATLNVKSWTATVGITVQNWGPTKTARITITPTSSSSPNILTSLTYSGSWNECYFRVLRQASGNSIVYFLTYLTDTQGSQNKNISMPIEVRYTAPASINLDYVEPIYGY